MIKGIPSLRKPRVLGALRQELGEPRPNIFLITSQHQFPKAWLAGVYPGKINLNLNMQKKKTVIIPVSESE